MSVHSLEELVDERGITLDELEDAVRSLPGPTRSRLTEHERQVLAGFGVEPDATSRSSLLSGLLRRQRLERESLTTEQVADMLRRQPSRVRQRLAGPHRSLLGFHRRSGRREWLLPAFQFDLGLYDLDGWARLLEALPPADDTSPVALVAWLTEPRAHLGGRSCAEALAEGANVERLLDDAESFGVLA